MCKNFKTCEKTAAATATTKNFNNLNSKSITDTKKLWMTIKLIFSNKSKTANTIILHENHR